MGIEGLLQALKPITIRSHISAFSNMTAAIDASVWLYKGAYSCSWELAQGIETRNYLNFIYQMIQLLKNNKITPIFIFDGSMLPMKASTVKKRTDDKIKYKKLGDEFLKAGDIEKAKIMYSRCISITKEMTTTLMDLLHYMKIQYIVAPYEADAQLAYCYIKGIADFVISEDSDLLVYGCENLVLKIVCDVNCENIKLHKTLSDQEFLSSNRNIFIRDIAKFSTFMKTGNSRPLAIS